MTFSRMMEQMQYSLYGKILFVSCGAFYIARGKDAILVNKLINLKLNCLSTGVCKVGFPINALEKYSKSLEETGYSFIIYKFNNETELLEVVKDYNGYYLLYKIIIMNEVFLIGKIITDINFKFIINSKKKKSIAIFDILTLDKQCISIKAYNKIADFVYSNLHENDYVFIYGYLYDNSISIINIKSFDNINY